MNTTLKAKIVEILNFWGVGDEEETRKLATQLLSLIEAERAEWVGKIKNAIDKTKEEYPCCRDCKRECNQALFQVLSLLKNQVNP